MNTHEPFADVAEATPATPNTYTPPASQTSAKGKGKTGRPPLNLSEAERKARRNARDAARRARERGEAPATPPAAPARDPKQRTIDEEIADLQDKYRAAGPAVEVTNTPAVENEPPKESFVTGYMLLAVCDSLIPALTALYFRRFKGRDIDPDDMRLTEKDKEALEKVADAAAQEIMGKLSPVSAFFLSSGAIYMSRIPKEVKP